MWQRSFDSRKVLPLAESMTLLVCSLIDSCVAVDRAILRVLSPYARETTRGIGEVCPTLVLLQPFIPGMIGVIGAGRELLGVRL